jgi:hypothetical protein
MTWGPCAATTSALYRPQASFPTMSLPPSLIWIPCVSIEGYRSGSFWDTPGEPRSLLPMASHMLPKHGRCCICPGRALTLPGASSTVPIELLALASLILAVVQCPRTSPITSEARGEGGDDGD